MIDCASANSSGVRWKHSSVSCSDAGQSRQAYPPPWFAQSDHPTDCTVPAVHVSIGLFGSSLPSFLFGGNCPRLLPQGESGMLEPGASHGVTLSDCSTGLYP